MMRNLVIAIAVVIAFSVAGAAYAAADKAARYILLLDGSSSTLAATDLDHAQRVAQDVADEIGELHMRDRITISIIGNFAGNEIREAEVNAAFPPDRALETVAGMIADFPNAVVKLGGPFPVTHIQGALMLHASRVDCSEVVTNVILVTDGLETGDVLRPQSVFPGCASMVMIGVIAPTPAETEAVTAAWTDWCQAAGFLSCSIRY